jgi:hypothetical protein
VHLREREHQDGPCIGQRKTQPDVQMSETRRIAAGIQDASRVYVFSKSRMSARDGETERLKRTVKQDALENGWNGQRQGIRLGWSKLANSHPVVSVKQLFKH